MLNLPHLPAPHKKPQIARTTNTESNRWSHSLSAQ